LNLLCLCFASAFAFVFETRNLKLETPSRPLTLSVQLSTLLPSREAIPMSHRALFGITLTLALVAFPLTARAQAAAESALANSASGAAGAKTGNALGRGLDQINNKLADRLGTATQSQQPSTGVQTVTLPPNQSAPNAPIPNNSPLVLSIQGAGTNCPAENKTANSAPPTDNKPVDTPAAATPADQSFVICDPRNTTKPKPKSKYNSVVEVSF
jgi:hypothetical protein